MASSVEGKLVPGYIAPNSVYDKRDIYQKIFNRHREETLFDYLIHSNRRMVTDNTTFNWFEDDFLFSSITVGSKAGTLGAGNPVTITISSVSHQEAGTLSPGKPKDQVIVYTATGNIQGYVTAKNTGTPNAHTLTIYPIDPSVNLVAAVAASGDLIGIMSNGNADGAGMVGSSVRKPLTFSNKTQIIKENYTVFGSEAANKVTFRHKGKEYFTYKGADDADLRHRLKIEYALMIGGGGIFTSARGGDPDNAGDVNFTTGLEGFADTYGNTEPYASTFGETDLDNIIKYLDGQRAGKDHLLLAAVNLNLSIDSFAKGIFDQGAIDHGQWGNGNNNMRYVDFGFDYIRKGNFVFHKMKADSLNYKPITGVTGSPYPDMGFTIPLMKVKNPSKNGPAEYDSIGIRYKAWDKENRFQKSWVRDENLTNLDQIEFNNKSEVGLMVPCSNMINKIELA